MKGEVREWKSGFRAEKRRGGAGSTLQRIERVIPSQRDVASGIGWATWVVKRLKQFTVDTFPRLAECLH